MSSQISFDDVRARRSDPMSSNEAAEKLHRSGNARAQMMKVLRAVFEYPGSTSRELAGKAGMDRYTTGRRLPELATRGLVLRDDPKGGELRWWPLEKGREVLDAIHV